MRWGGRVLLLVYLSHQASCSHGIRGQLFFWGERPPTIRATGPIEGSGRVIRLGVDILGGDKAASIESLLVGSVNEDHRAWRVTNDAPGIDVARGDRIEVPFRLAPDERLRCSVVVQRSGRSWEGAVGPLYLTMHYSEPDSAGSQTAGAELGTKGAILDISTPVRITHGEREVLGKGLTHVVVLPGVNDDNSHCAALLADEIERNTRDTTVHVWNWRNVERSGPYVRLPYSRDEVIPWVIAGKIAELKGRKEDLTNGAKNRRRAIELRRQLFRWKKRFPESRVVIVGLSAGAQIAYYLCNADPLPAEPPFDAILMLSGALSADRDLSRMVAHTRRGVLNYSSENDETLRSAEDFAGSGLIGRRGASSRDGVYELRWVPEMRQYNNKGAHLQCLTPSFSRKFVLPVLGNAKVAWSGMDK